MAGDDLPAFPTSWKIERARHVFDFGKGLAITKDDLQDVGIPCVSYGEVHSRYGFEVDPRIHELKCVDPSYLKNGATALLREGDFVFADTSEDLEGSGNFTYFNSNEAAFAGYHTIIARAKMPFHSRFMAYLFDSVTFRAQVRTEVTGVKVFSITQSILKGTSVWLPPVSEQLSITAFLDQKCGKIDEAVRIKEEQIALLRERRQFLIQEAVLRGLNPDAPMKDSGVDWIGKTPSHWRVVPLRYLCRIHAGNGFPIDLQGDEDGSIPFLKVSDFSHQEIIITTAKNYVTPRTVQNRKWNVVPKGTLLAAKIGEALRKNHRNISGVDCLIDNNCIGLEPTGIDTMFFYYLNKVIDFDWFVNPGAVPSMSVQGYRSERVAVPPLCEQMAIAERIDGISSKIDEAITIDVIQIKMLKEYRSMLIDAVVTGKIKVA